MSSQALVQGPDGVLAAWETDGQVQFARVDPPGAPVAAPGATRGRKHPVLAVNGRGEVLLAWTEGTGWNRGGALAWQVYDRSGRPTEAAGRVEGGVPVWGVAAAAVLADGRFLVIH
jgi:hypothetical protein